ncbi:MAG: hypothetical protein MAG551_01585 [Candidatus Scalindua arabica]|uniref:Carboxymuconolactone decarboxylase-like domain-containing protein n=1 Tax=Candidatus Scalindua arabica TaxID=1127984 RepID=A0A942A2M5_9BACT|nr:hypothetical protein [Candidatus Scalindua arabica]
MPYELPSQFKDIAREYPDVCKVFENLGTQCHEAGPLDEKTRRLVKLGISIGTGSEGAVHSAVRNALKTGVSKRRNSARRYTCYHDNRITKCISSDDVD